MAEGVGARTPKYHRIADAVREQIRTGGLADGERLPAETTIATEHRASVPTVRQAMAVLRAEGLIESRHGIGTFVSESHRLQRRSRNRYGEARGRDGLLANTYRHDIVSVTKEAVPEHIADPMRARRGTKVVVRRRRLFNDTDQLVEIGASYLPAKIADGTYLSEPKVVPKALFRCVEELTGKTYSHARDQWTARRATSVEADAFNLQAGGYVLHVIHTATDQANHVLEVSESIWPADRVLFVDDYAIPSTPARADTHSDV